MGGQFSVLNCRETPFPYLYNLDAQGGHNVGHGGVRRRLELRRQHVEAGEAVVEKATD